MSQAIVNAVWASDLPDFLKWGVAGKLATLADDDGEFFPGTISINYLANQRYGRKNYRLHKQTIKYQTYAVAQCGFLLITGVGGGRGHKRGYRLNVAALVAVQADDPMLRRPQRRAGAGPDGRILPRRYPTSEARKGDTNQKNTPERPQYAPIGHERSAPPVAHAPPALAAGSSPGKRPRWDAIRTPDQNFKVLARLADDVLDKLIVAGQFTIEEGEIIETLKRRAARVFPGQLQNTAQVLAALDAAAYRRRMLGLPVPTNAGSRGQSMFTYHRQQHTSGHARMDAR